MKDSTDKVTRELSFNDIQVRMEKMPPEKEIHELRWVCGFCNHKNHPHRDFCGMCSEKKGHY